MIYRLSTAYLSRLEGERNSKLFYGYVVAAAICAVAIWQLGPAAALMGVAAFVAAAVYHRKLNQFHGLRMAAALHVEVEVLSDWAAAGFKDTLLRWKMKPEVVHGNEKAVQPRVQA